MAAEKTGASAAGNRYGSEGRRVGWGRRKSTAASAAVRRWGGCRQQPGHRQGLQMKGQSCAEPTWGPEAPAVVVGRVGRSHVTQGRGYHLVRRRRYEWPTVHGGSGLGVNGGERRANAAPSVDQAPPDRNHPPTADRSAARGFTRHRLVGWFGWAGRFAAAAAAFGWPTLVFD